MKRIAALIGDYYHRQDWIAASLETAFRPMLEAGGAELSFINMDHLEETLKGKPDVVILFREQRIDPSAQDPGLWMGEETARAIIQFVEEGGTWLAWHSGMAGYPEDGAYVDMLRGNFIMHPEMTHVTYTPDPFAEAKGYGEFAFKDEHYIVRCEEERVKVLMRSKSEHGDSVAAWAHPYGKGLVVCLTPAHTEEGLLHPELHKWLRAAIEGTVLESN